MIKFNLQGSRAAIRNLNSKINKLDHDSLKQQEIIYNQVRNATILMMFSHLFWTCQKNI